jgi:bifunctional DNase/RNase
MIAATDTGLVPMRVSKVVALMDGDNSARFMVLDELDGDRHLVIQVGQIEAFGLATGLQGLWWGRPMTYQFAVALVRGLGGRVRQVRLDRIVDGAYAATVEVEGPQGVAMVDARSSDALNLAVLTDAPVFVVADVLADCIGRQAGDSVEATLMRRALTARPMTIHKALQRRSSPRQSKHCQADHGEYEYQSARPSLCPVQPDRCQWVCRARAQSRAARFVRRSCDQREHPRRRTFTANSPHLTHSLFGTSRLLLPTPARARPGAWREPQASALDGVEKVVTALFECVLSGCVERDDCCRDGRWMRDRQPVLA